MTENFTQQLSSVRKAFDQTKSNTADIRKSLSINIEKLTQFAPRYEDSWAGDWTENADLYFRNFDRSSGEGIRINEEHIKDDLKKLSEIDLDELQKDIPSISKQFFQLKDYILSELSFIKDIEAFKNEIELLGQIENFQWGMEPGEYIRSRRPKHVFVHDPKIINRGLSTPPHIAVIEDIIFTISILASYEHFETLVHRFLRQLEIKSSNNMNEEASALFEQQALKNILDKFHVVATQIKNRYDGRSTITIKDEYDVQDIMNALLRINFEDVRKEEYTPSYAGGSTRIDFLLKREKILIEVKKTRANLKDKDVGNQLIIDIAHYKSHPDCKHLVCFVYDPDNLIVNPRGLEYDLNMFTTEEMIVEVYVRP